MNFELTEQQMLQKKKYIPSILSGEAFGSFGLTEPNAGSDAGGVQV